MKIFHVHSLPLAEVIRDLAEAFNTNYDHTCGEYFLTIPPDIGKGFIKGMNFKDGLGLIYYDCTFLEDIELHFIVNHVHPLKFLYCLEGSISHRFENENLTHTIDQYQNAVVSSSRYNGHVLHFKKDVHNYISSVEISRKEFKNKMECELGSMGKQLQDLFHDVEAKSSFYYDGFYSFKIADLIADTQTFVHEDFLRKIYLEGVVYHILAEQILQYQDDSKDEGNRILLRRSEIKLIEKAATLIENELSDLETIDIIASKIGLNVNKLQEGFKILHKMTVNQYIQKLRFTLAKNLLLNTELSMSEITDRIGLSSKSYFSKIFKEHYNITPSEFRAKHLSFKKH